MSIAVSPALTTNTNFYKYEPFVYTFTGGSSFSVSGSSILTAFCTATDSNVVFASVNGFQSTGSSGGESLVVRSSIGSNAYTFFINAGRFVSQASPVVPIPVALSLFFGEATSIPFIPAPGGSVTVTTAYQTPTLPVGMSFNDVTTNWVLSGTPRLTSATSNYLFVGSNSAGQVISSSLTIGVAPERMTLTASSSSQTLITSPPTAITPITLSNGAGNSSFITNVVFTLPTLPDGLNYYSNAVPNLITSSILTAPIGTSVVIAGTPTTSNVTTSNVSVVITTSGVSASQTTLTASSTLSFTYSPAVLFTLPTQTSNILYVGVPVSSTLATTYGLQLSAYTAFSPTVQPVIAYSPTSILPGVNIISNSSGWFISGTPTSVGSLSVTVYASNAAGLVGSNVLSFDVQNPVINVSATSGLQSFIVGRALSNSFTYSSGSYVYPITYTITSPAYQTTGWLASNNLVFSNLPVGLSNTLAPVGAGYQVTLIGIPTATASAAQVTLRATVGAVFGLGSVVALVNPDVFTFSTPTPMPFVFSQNIPITPIQMFVSTLSETPVLYFTGEGLPIGLSITSTGSLQGTPLVSTLVGSGSGFGFLSPGADYVTFSATNGYTTATPLSTQFPYKTIADSFNIVSNSVLITAGTAVNIPILYSMPSGLNNAVVSYPSTQPYIYGLGITGSTTSNALTGTLSNGVWPNFIVQAPGPVVLTASSTVGGLTSVSTAVVSLNDCNTQAIIRYVVGLNAARTSCTVYSSSNSFSFSNIVYTGTAGGFADMQLLQSGALGTNCLYTLSTGSATPSLYGSADSGFSNIAYSASNPLSTAFSRSLQTPFTLYALSGADGPCSYSVSVRDTQPRYPSKIRNVTISPRSDGSVIFRWLPQYADRELCYNKQLSFFSFGAFLLGGVGGLQSVFLTNSTWPTSNFYVNASNTACTLTTVNDIETHGYPIVVAVGSNASGNTIQYSPIRTAGISTGIGRLSNTGVLTLTSGGPFTVGSYLFGGGSGGTQAASGTRLFPETTITVSNSPTSYIVSPGPTYTGVVDTTFVSTTDMLSPGTVWSNATNAFTLSGTNVVWGGYSNTSGGQTVGWMATGLNTGDVPSVKFSSNAASWIDIPFPFTVGTTVGPLQFDGSFWNILVNTTTVYRHGLDTSSITDTSSWTSNTVSFSGGPPSSIASFPIPAYDLVPESPVTLTYLTAVTGPTFTLPSVTTYRILQYVPITPVLFDAYASDTASVYYLGLSNLPSGMVWSPRTPSSNGQYYIGSISGLGVNVGTFPVDVYARNSAGTTKITVTFIISRPFPTLSRNTGSAYTAFTREKVIADAETNATDNHVHPYSVGQFLLDRPPDETTAPPICFQPDSTFLQRQRDAAAAAEASALASVLAYQNIAEAAAAAAAATTSIPVAQTASNAAAAAAASAAAIAASFTSVSTIVAASAQTAAYAAQAAASLANLQGQKAAWANAGRQAVVVTAVGTAGTISKSDGGGLTPWPLYNNYSFGRGGSLYDDTYLTVSALMPDNSNIVTVLSVNSVRVFATVNISKQTIAYGSNISFKPNVMCALSSSALLATTTSNISIIQYPSGSSSVFAGSSLGYANGTGVSAQFSNMRGLVIDSNSNIYVADSGNHAIRKITYPDAAVTTIAGGVPPLQTTATGPSISTTGSYSFVMASNPGFSNGIMLKVSKGFDPTFSAVGTVTNIVGLTLTLSITSLIYYSGPATYTLISGLGSADGVGLNARFNNPSGLAITQSGSLVVMDIGNSSIRLITPSESGTIWTTTTVVSGLTMLIRGQLSDSFPITVLPTSNTIMFAGCTSPSNTNNFATQLFSATLSGGTWSVALEAGGTSQYTGVIDGTGTSSSFQQLTSLCVIPTNGNIIGFDSSAGGASVVRIISPSV